MSADFAGGSNYEEYYSGGIGLSNDSLPFMPSTFMKMAAFGI